MIEENITELLQNNKISQSANPIACLLVLVSKKDGFTRICVDYRQLNKITVKFQFPVLRVDDTLDSLHNSKYFTKIDLKNGYWQVPVKQ